MLASMNWQPVWSTFVPRFGVSVAENLAFGRPEATHDEIRAAADAVGAAAMIEALPEGFDTPITDRGAALSAGQRQLISLARMLVTDARLIILDEATSSLDMRSEAMVDRAMHTLMRGRTAVVIAHRLSTVRNAHRIHVMERGVVAESGTHEQLLARGGLYAALWRVQTGEVDVTTNAEPAYDAMPAPRGEPDAEPRPISP